MESNVHSTRQPTDCAGGGGRRAGRPGPRPPADAALAEQVLQVRRQLDRLEGQWLRALADVDGRGAAGAEHGLPAASTAAWLRHRLRLGPAPPPLGSAAWALHQGPLTGTAQALAAGGISRPTPRSWPPAPTTCPTAPPPTPNRSWWTGGPAAGPAPAAAGRRPSAAGRRPRPPDQAAPSSRHQQRGCGWRRPGRAWSPSTGCWARRPARPCWRPGTPGPPGQRRRPRSGSQRRADALAELARRTLEAGQLPQTGGVRPQLLVTVDLDSLLGPRPGRRDRRARGRWTRRRAAGWLVTARSPGSWSPATLAPTTTRAATTWRPGSGWRRPGLPPALGGGRTQPLEVGRTSRVVSAAQRAALVVRDGGCALAGCDRPPAWCEAHHLLHWLHGGPTDLENLALVCRAHHRAVHEGGWRLARDPDGHLTATPPHRRPQRPPAAA